MFEVRKAFQIGRNYDISAGNCCAVGATMIFFGPELCAISSSGHARAAAALQVATIGLNSSGALIMRITHTLAAAT